MRRLDERKEQTSKPFSKPTDCVAHNCPLPGAYRLSNESSICAVHEEAEAHYWPLITERIHSLLSEFGGVYKALYTETRVRFIDACKGKE